MIRDIYHWRLQTILAVVAGFVTRQVLFSLHADPS